MKLNRKTCPKELEVFEEVQVFAEVLCHIIGRSMTLDMRNPDLVPPLHSKQKQNLQNLTNPA